MSTDSDKGKIGRLRHPKAELTHSGRGTIGAKVGGPVAKLLARTVHEVLIQRSHATVAHEISPRTPDLSVGEGRGACFT